MLLVYENKKKAQYRTLRVRILNVDLKSFSEGKSIVKNLATKCYTVQYSYKTLKDITTYIWTLELNDNIFSLVYHKINVI